MRLPLLVSAADRRVLPEGRLAGPMPYVIAIMMALTVLAAAAGLTLSHASHVFTEALSDRISVQIVEADSGKREAQTAAALAILRRAPAVTSVHRVPAAEIGRLLQPWLGSGIEGADLPLPAMVDADLARGARGDLPELVRSIRGAAPSARVDDHAGWLAPLAGLFSTLIWLALALVVLMAAATSAVVVLAARGALNTNRSTIDVLHLMGGTDLQVARLFQRRIALDALFGSLTGLGGAAVMLLVVGHEIAGTRSALIQALTLTPVAWGAILLMPIATTALATFAARWTVLAALRRLP